MAGLPCFIAQQTVVVALDRKHVPCSNDRTCTRFDLPSVIDVRCMHLGEVGRSNLRPVPATNPSKTVRPRLWIAMAGSSLQIACIAKRMVENLRDNNLR